jgi:hypothetical protein
MFLVALLFLPPASCSARRGRAGPVPAGQALPVSGSVIEVRTIIKPVSGTVKVHLDGVEQLSGWSVDTITGACHLRYTARARRRGHRRLRVRRPGQAATVDVGTYAGVHMPADDRLVEQLADLDDSALLLPGRRPPTLTPICERGGPYCAMALPVSASRAPVILARTSASAGIP